jgi:hypothetical protein
LSYGDDLSWLRKMPTCRIAPLQKIDWRKEFYLKEVLHKLESLQNVRSIQVEGDGLSALFMYLAMIAERINEDGAKFNLIEEIYQHVNSNKKLTDSEIEELDKGPFYVSLFCLDMSSLIIFLRIFMDKLARFLGLLMAMRGIKTKSFAVFKGSLKELKGKEIEAFVRVIEENTTWFDELKDLRDDYVVHHPGSATALLLADGKAYVTLTTSKRTKEPKHVLMNSEAKDIPIEEIDSLLSNLKKLLSNLSAFLAENLEKLPFKVA